MPSTHYIISTMLVTGIILAPVAIATPAVQDLINLRTIINAAANTIGDTNNPNRGWGFGSAGGQMGTADLVNNATNAVLAMKWQIDTNKVSAPFVSFSRKVVLMTQQTAWLLPDNVTLPTTNITTPTPTPFTPTLPLSTSIVMPSTLPTSVANATMDLSTPYIDYISSIPNLSTSLTSLGRFVLPSKPLFSLSFSDHTNTTHSAYHREMNAPVKDAISGLQQCISTLQSAMLQDNLISSQAILRTIRASSSLEAAQVAWGRYLNLPGTVGSAGGDSGTSESDTGGLRVRKRSLEDAGGAGKVIRPPPSHGRYYTHDELWSREGPKPRQLKGRKASWHNAVVQGAENARIGRPFVV
ncbi:hypothetical protein EK21DRAFT_70887 [Setomelanomma holmii]|uniref:Uncharacterized protein n=1 Tax=Setomelanomma holmii TaxID=210430 RepID=A0A9P4LK67_9PLEO|nr:hypothetical protein EK21DRAFT_70887 [Setomelanomma holmii]